MLDDQDSDLVRRLMGQRDEANSALQVRNGSGIWNAHSGAGLVAGPQQVSHHPPIRRRLSHACWTRRARWDG